MNLSDLKNNETAFVSTVGGSNAFHLRLEEMGFVPGQEVTRLYAFPLGSPIVFSMIGQRVALRRGEAEQISIVSEWGDVARERPETSGGMVSRVLPERAESCHPSCCAGCAGCGHSRRSRRSGRMSGKADKADVSVALVGNPNCGKTAFFNAASGGHERTGNYAGVTVGSVERHVVFEGTRLRIVDLPGTYSLRAFSPEEAFVSNELAKNDVDVIINVLDVNNLERNLLLTVQLRERGIPMVGVLNMYDEFRTSDSRLDVAELERRLDMPLIPAVAKHKEGIEETLRAAISLARKHKTVQQPAGGKSTWTVTERTKWPTDGTGAHAFIHELLDGIYELKEGRTLRLTALADKFLARTPLAYLLFFLLMGVIFYATFEIGAYPMEWMEGGVDRLSGWLSSVMSAGCGRDLLVGGIIGGVGSVIVFLPNILILYFFISILEDSGYLSRAALLADPLLRRVGLHGKSFIPMLMGFGCNVPAVMATRTIESRKSRLVTMMTLPFMSCSARLPVYTVLSGAFFPEYAAWVMLALYAGGILAAFSSAWLLNKFFHRSEESHFVMEMPPYRMPVMYGVLRHTWEKGRQYLHKMGGIILIASVVVWALGYFPHSVEEVTPAQQQEQSFLGQIGHAMQPVIEPLGYDWRMGVGLLSGIGAKELMVSTLGVLYNVPEDADEDGARTRLSEALQSSDISQAAALGYLVFALLYFPCLATIAVIRGESGRWKYALFTAAYTTAVAYVAAFIVYRVALLF